MAGDRGYRGQKYSGDTKIIIPNLPSSRDTRYKKKRKLFRKRAGIEPTIGHLKSDHRLNRNFYKGIVGDVINVMLAAATYNFKRAMKVLLRYVFWSVMKLNIVNLFKNFILTQKLSDNNIKIVIE